MKKPETKKKTHVAATMLTRSRAEKISAVEGLVLSRPLREAFDEFDRNGVSGDERRASLRARFQKQSA